MKRYDYQDRTIIEFDDGARVGYSVKIYGALHEQIVNQSMALKTRLGNPYSIHHNGVTLYSLSRKGIVSTVIDYDVWLTIRHCYWFMDKDGYFITKSKKLVTPHQGATIRLHNLVMWHWDYETYVVDHINNEKWDNRKVNLKVATFSENSKNLRDDYSNNKNNLPRGITLRKTCYEVRINHRGKCVYRTTFPLDKLKEAMQHNDIKRKEYGFLK